MDPSSDTQWSAYQFYYCSIINISTCHFNEMAKTCIVNCKDKDSAKNMYSYCPNIKVVSTYFWHDDRVDILVAYSITTKWCGQRYKNKHVLWFVCTSVHTALLTQYQGGYIYLQTLQLTVLSINTKPKVILWRTYTYFIVFSKLNKTWFKHKQAQLYGIKRREIIVITT